MASEGVLVQETSGVIASVVDADGSCEGTIFSITVLGRVVGVNAFGCWEIIANGWFMPGGGNGNHACVCSV